MDFLFKTSKCLIERFEEKSIENEIASEKRQQFQQALSTYSEFTSFLRLLWFTCLISRLCLVDLLL